MTIYDIAREAGVSASTVSRVINHKPGIKESTRQRVQELLERYHSEIERVFGAGSCYVLRLREQGAVRVG